MKRSFLVIALLVSILFWGVNAAAFAQNQVKKDTVMHKVTKEMTKKGDVKKIDKKDVTKTVETKKDGMQKEVTKTTEVKKEGMKKDMIKKGDVKKDEMKKEITSKKEVKEVKTIIKDKEIGKTADGKVIYEGPKGGKYTLSDKGTKVYIKKEVKKEVK